MNLTDLMRRRFSHPQRIVFYDHQLPALLRQQANDAHRRATAALDLHGQSDDLGAFAWQPVEVGHVFEHGDVFVRQDAVRFEVG